MARGPLKPGSNPGGRPRVRDGSEVQVTVEFPLEDYAVKVRPNKSTSVHPKLVHLDRLEKLNLPQARTAQKFERVRAGKAAPSVRAKLVHPRVHDLPPLIRRGAESPWTTASEDRALLGSTPSAEAGRDRWGG